MGSGEAGKKRFDALAAKHDKKWLKENVEVTSVMMPAHRVVTYKFIGEGEPLELIDLTIQMGNKPSFDVGPVPARAKAGKDRRGRRAAKKKSA